MRIFDAEATRAALPFDRLIPALKSRFIAGCEVPPRHVHEIVAPVGDVRTDPAHRRMTSLIMPAWIPGKYYGVKIINMAPGNAARGLPGLHGIYLLFDARTGVPLAQIDGNEMTARRTAGASALAAGFLARPDAQQLLVVGAGRVASLIPEAYRVTLPGVSDIRVWARKADQAEQLTRQLQQKGFNASTATSVEAGCSEADIVSCATLATEPVVKGHWLQPGSHLDLIGSFTPAMREADDACFEGARVFIDTDEALVKSGDLISPMNRGIFTADEVRGTLTTLCKGVATGRKTPKDRTVFKSVGTALEDLAAAVLVYESA